MRDIIKLRRTCNQHFGFNISKKTRVRKYADARKMFYKLSKDLLNETTHEIGKAVKVNHSTVVVGQQRLEDLLIFDKETQENFLLLKEKCIEMVKKYRKSI